MDTDRDDSILLRIRSVVSVNKKVMMVLGSGGHTAQMLRLLKLLGGKYDYVYVVNNNDITTIQKINGKIYTIARTRSFGDSYIKIFFNAIRGIYKSFNVIRKERPYAIISSGPGLTIPLFIAGKIFGCKTIYIETWARAHTKSASGKVCYYIADKFFVQWPEMKKLYPDAIYAGRLG